MMYADNLELDDGHEVGLRMATAQHKSEFDPYLSLKHHRHQQ